MSVNLYKITPMYISYYKANSTSMTTSQVSSDIISTFFEAKGEILVVMRPSDVLDISVTTDTNVYVPGDTVNYSVVVKDRNTKKVVTDRDVIITVKVTDDSVFSQIEDRKQPPSIGAAIFLEN